jgi:hypothetical protein
MQGAISIKQRAMSNELQAKSKSYSSIFYAVFLFITLSPSLCALR